MWGGLQLYEQSSLKASGLFTSTTSIRASQSFPSLEGKTFPVLLLWSRFPHRWGTVVLADGANETLVSWQQTDTRLELRCDSKRQTRWKLPPNSGILGVIRGLVGMALSAGTKGF